MSSLKLRKSQRARCSRGVGNGWPPAPSVVAALCVVGVPPLWAAAGGFSLNLALAAAGAILVVVLFVIGCRWRPFRGTCGTRRTRAAAHPLVLGLLVGLATVSFIAYRTAVRSAPPTLSIDARGPITLRGRAAADLRPSATGVRYLPVFVESVSDRRGWSGTGRGVVALLWDGQETLLTHDGRARRAPQRGDTVFVRATGDTVRSGTIWANSDAMTVEPAQSVPNRVRRHIRAGIYRRFARLDRRSRALMAALVLGDRSGIDPATYDAVRRSGAAHVLALSGMHLGVLALAVTWLGKRFLSRNVAIITTVLVLGSYVWVAGWIPSLLRALAMVGFASVSRVLGRREAPVVILSRAVLLLALIDPGIVYQLGFQYSVLALTGILCLSPVTVAFFEHLVPRVVAVYLGVSLAALIPTAVLSLSVFGTLYPAGIVTAGALSAIVVVVIWTGLLFTVVGSVPVLGTVVAQFIATMTSLLEQVAQVGALIPAISPGRVEGMRNAITFSALLVLGTGLVLLLRRHARRQFDSQKVAMGESQLDF